MKRKYLKPKRKYWKSRNSTVRKKYFTRGKINEYFYKKEKANWQIKVLVLFLIFVCGYIIYFFLFSNYFKINQIIVEGNEEIPSSDIKDKCNYLLNKRRFLIFKNNNYFLFNTDEIVKELSSEYLFNYLKVKKRYFSTIFITLREKPHKLIYVIDNNHLLIDKDGVFISRLDEIGGDKEKIIIKEVPNEIIVNQEEIDEQKSKIVIGHAIYNDTNNTSTVFIWIETEQGMIVKEVPIIEPKIERVYSDLPEIGQKIFFQDIVDKILYLDNNYNNKFSQQERNYYKYYPDKTNFLTMITEEDLEIYFKLDDSLDSQLSNLYRYLVEERDYDLQNIEYIDLRQNNQIIIK